MSESAKIPVLFEQALFEPALRAAAALTRLDERLRKSPVRKGYIARMEFHEAVASLWLGGELVHLEDLVLHDAHMDIRAPTHELTLAHQVLRATRQVTASPPEWALSPKGIQSLCGQRSVLENRGEESDAASNEVSGDNHEQTKPKPVHANATHPTLDDDFGEDEIAAAGLFESARDVSFAAQELDRDLAEMDTRLKRLDAVLHRTANGGRVVSGDGVGEVEKDQISGGASSGHGLNPLICDEDDNADERLSEWLARMMATRGLPQIVRAALALDDWNQNDIFPRTPWLGPLIAASILRSDGKQNGKAGGQGPLPAIFMGLRQIPRERRNAKDQNVRLVVLLEAFEQSALIGLKEHDRLILAREQMLRKLKGKRTNSKLPQLIELVLSRPLVTSTMIERELKVTLQGALNLVAELGVREVTGRGRYRAWAVV